MILGCASMLAPGLVVAHSVRVGGYDLDEAIVRLLQDEERLLIGQEQAEVLKIEIGNALPSGNGSVAGEVAGRDLVTGLLRRAPVTAAQVQRALQRPISQIVDAVKLVLERTPPELSSDVARPRSRARWRRRAATRLRPAPTDGDRAPGPPSQTSRSPPSPPAPDARSKNSNDSRPPQPAEHARTRPTTSRQLAMLASFLVGHSCPVGKRANSHAKPSLRTAHAARIAE